MKKIIYCITLIIVLSMTSLSVQAGGVVGDGYGTIGGGEQTYTPVYTPTTAETPTTEATEAEITTEATTDEVTTEASTEITTELTTEIITTEIATTETTTEETPAEIETESKSPSKLFLFICAALGSYLFCGLGFGAFYFIKKKKG